MIGPLVIGVWSPACHSSVPVERVEGHKVVARVSGEEQVARRRKQARTNAAPAFPTVAPPDFAGAVVDGLEHRNVVAAPVVSAPTLGFFAIVIQVVHAVGAGGIGVEQSGVRVETLRRPIDGPVLVGRHQCAVQLRLLAGLGSGRPSPPTPRVQFVPTKSVLTRFSPVSRSITKNHPLRLAWATSFRGSPSNSPSNNTGVWDGIPIVRVVRGDLEIPDQFARVRIQCDDRLGIEVVPFAPLAGDDGLRVARAQIQEIQFGVVGAWNPGHPAGVHHGLGAGPRRRLGVVRIGTRIPPPLHLAGLGSYEEGSRGCPDRRR